MIIRHLKRIMYIITIATILYSCNSDVFISDYAPSDREIKLSEEDSTCIISFEAPNWDIKSITYQKEGILHEIVGDIYGKDGNLIEENAPLFTSGGEQIKMEIRHSDVKLTIERTDATHLCFSNPENMSYENMRLYLNVGNDYNTKQISIDIEPFERYKLDSVTYRLDSYYYKDSMMYKIESSSYTNLTDEIRAYEIHPYKSFMIDYVFINTHELETVLTEDKLKIFGKDAPVIPVPIIDKYNTPVITGITMPLSAATQNLPIPDKMLESKEIMHVNPLKQRTYTVKCWYEYYGIKFKIHASRQKTGSKRILEGLLDIYIPKTYSISFGKEIDVNIQKDSQIVEK